MLLYKHGSMLGRHLLFRTSLGSILVARLLGEFKAYSIEHIASVKLVSLSSFETCWRSHHVGKVLRDLSQLQRTSQHNNSFSGG